MIQFKIVSGKMAGVEKTARHFPFTIGRSSACDLQAEEEGVWDRHLELNFDAGRGFILTTSTNAMAIINGQSSHETVLRNGDLIEIGALKIRFWLGRTRQTSLRAREWLTWIGCALIVALEIFLIYRLTP